MQRWEDGDKGPNNLRWGRISLLLIAAASLSVLPSLFHASRRHPTSSITLEEPPRRRDGGWRRTGSAVVNAPPVVSGGFGGLDNHHRRLHAAMAAPAVSMSSTVSVADKGMALPGVGSAVSMSGTASLADHGTAVPGPGTSLNMLRRAKDVVSATDVPFLLMTPRKEVVDNYYVSSHDRPASMFHNMGERFHFIATPHYQEGASLLTLRHKGRVIIMLRHPSAVAESMYLSRPGTKRGDLAGLVAHVNSTDYYDNWMTRMLANVPRNGAVTEEHFRAARMILENKFIIGLVDDIRETVQRRLSLYFGWKDVLGKDGCELQHVQRAVTASPPPTSLQERGREWQFLKKRNRFDTKLYVRGVQVFWDQKMRVPVHETVREEQRIVSERAFGRLRDMADEREASDLPFFWHIPKASGTTAKETMSDCYGLVRTEMIKPPSSLDIVGKDNRILNLDLTTPAAVHAAREVRAADRGLADVFVSQLSLEGSTVFTKTHRGRAFTIMRHPVKLTVSLFYYRRIATWEPTYRPEFKDITLREYVSMDGYYDNWMVRMLTNAKLGGLNRGHLELAQKILKNKFLIGISDHMDETFRRLELHYGWKEIKQGCVKFHLHSAHSNKNKYPVPDQGGPVWSIIAEKNKFDMALYYYALDLCKFSPLPFVHSHPFEPLIPPLLQMALRSW
ncbi:hypothetical protein ACHAWF_002813 [Thalassiosira exigua]